ncbi:MAG TPA: 9-O-acetylesterase [Bacteroides sp.]|nr:9-O-acetylesterase [Bacteroides sp.]
MKKHSVRVTGLAILSLLAACSEPGQVKVADIFGDNMVLQAETPVNIWGTGDPGSRVIVQFRNQEKTVRVERDSTWKTVLDPLIYGGPDSLVITSGARRTAFHNVLVGEVWVCSGQSNMEMPMISGWAHLDHAGEEVRNAVYPEMRLFTVGHHIAFQPVDTLVTEGWKECNPQSVRDFSATAYFFGRMVHRELGVPVGLINTSWGGTVAEAWMSAGSLKDLEDFSEKVELIAKKAAARDSLLAEYIRDTRKMEQEIRELDAGITDGDTVFANGKADTSDWLTLDLPRMWEETGLGVFDGSVWFVKAVELSPFMASSDLTLCYSAPDDWDQAWVNGVKVGESRAWDVPREYEIPEGVAVAGTNTIVIRIMDTGGGGGFMGEATQFAIRSSLGQSIPIATSWKAKKGFDFEDVKTIPVSPFDPNQPTVLFNGMIHPLVPFTIRGSIWYQGESNAGRAFQYRRLFRALITDWRQLWGQGDFPFFFVQLANYLRRNETPVEDTWAELREAQAMALALPNTGMAVTIDIGDALDIHPGNKQDVGKRLALHALAIAYGQDIPYSGPLYAGMEIQGNLIEVSFDYVYDGLKTADGGELKGFSICGKDREFVWAEAEIRGNKVQVWAPGIGEPVAVRYGWSSNPECNLVNSADLPASPFRTDSFRGITEPD